ncbi:hypothetical protein L1887_00967 [Cichorium endivia]|nr:hypothetical protein L1887_00967 [Cichorium endivia]
MWVLWSLLSAASSRRSSVSERSDEPAVDEVATKAVISVLSGYAGKYLKGNLSETSKFTVGCSPATCNKYKDLNKMWVYNLTGATFYFLPLPQSRLNSENSNILPLFV